MCQLPHPQNIWGGALHITVILPSQRPTKINHICPLGLASAFLLPISSKALREIMLFTVPYISKETSTSNDYLYLVCHTPIPHSINIQCKEPATMKSNYGEVRPQEITEHIISKTYTHLFDHPPERDCPKQALKLSLE